MNAKTVELHLIQSFPPSCVNRDGNNSPKDCTFGGERRARISSQCLKRAIRTADVFAETAGVPIADRSKLYGPILREILEALGAPDADAAAKTMLAKLASADKKNAEKSSVLLYFGRDELREMARAYLANPGDDKWKKTVPRTSPDVALFGRMLAESTGLNVDAGAQVAHAISTHRLSQEMDYWTAVDDLQPDEDAAAGMLGTAEFNASVFYRYACVSLPILAKNLAEDEAAVRRTVEAFLRASFDAIPTGKINGHAHFTPPSVALAVVRRKGQPLNLANAFLRPVRDTKDGYEVGSARELLAHLERMRKMVPAGDADYVLAHGLAYAPETEGVETAEGYDDLIRRVGERLG
jgi:CRISPR system Cascade subunit CasC